MNIGKKYFSGNGKHAKDNAKGFDYTERAAEAGNPDAAFMIGQCYYYGYAAKKDAAQAKVWLQKSLEGAGDDDDLKESINKLLAGEAADDMTTEKMEELIEFDTGKGTKFQREKIAEQLKEAEEKEDLDIDADDEKLADGEEAPEDEEAVEAE